MKIQWIAIDLQERHFEKAALTFPLRLNGLEQTATVQLDTGCGRSYAFGPSSLDLSEVSFQFDGQTHSVPCSGDDQAQEFGILMGTDLLRELVVEINFKEDEIRFLKESEISSEYKFIQGRTDIQGRLFLPLTFVKYGAVEVMYDSGASLFDISSTQELAEQILPVAGLPYETLALPPYSHPDGNTELPLRIYDLDCVVQLGDLARTKWSLSTHSSKNPGLDFSQGENPSFGLIGTHFFNEQKSIVIDFKNSRLGFL